MDKKFIRVTEAHKKQFSKSSLVGCVGIVSSFGQNERDTEEMYFVELHGGSGINVFTKSHVELITEKEYFKGCLRG